MKYQKNIKNQPLNNCASLKSLKIEKKWQKSGKNDKKSSFLTIFTFAPCFLVYYGCKHFLHLVVENGLRWKRRPMMKHRKLTTSAVLAGLLLSSAFLAQVAQADEDATSSQPKETVEASNQNQRAPASISYSFTCSSK